MLRLIPKLLSTGLFALLMLQSLNLRGEDTVEAGVPIRIGWQIPAATQGQVLQVLKRTSVLEAHGLEPSFVPFSYGGPQVEAAFAGKLDVFFSGDQPAINLIARGGRWKIVARLFDDGLGIIVPPNSPIQNVQDLKGKTVASAFGSVAHRDAFMEQEAAGLDPHKDVVNKNLDILEIRNQVQAGGNGSWNGVDAALVWDPILSRFKQEGLARSITSGRYLGVVAVSEAFIDDHPEAVSQLLVALMRSWDFFSRHPDRVMEWYIDDARLDYSPESLVSARLDTNFSASSLNEVSLELTPEYLATLEAAAAWARDSGEGSIQVSDAVDTGLLDTAMELVANNQYKEIQVILPSTDDNLAINENYIFDLYTAPLLGVFAAMILLALLAIESGFLLGKRNRKNIKAEQVTPIATVVGAIL
ncbi:MAG: ABC transporter substrate-binding protein, partial [Pseudomonadales bacterium]